MAGIELRVSRPSNWSQCRQRGDSVIEGELVMLDLAASDSLTADYTTTNGKTSLGSRSTASTPLGTVIPATDALAHGRVGVAMGAVADNALGLYEFGEIGDGTHGDVIVRALVLSATANAAGVALEVDVASSVGRFTLKSAGATFATLLEDTGNTGANVLAWVVLHAGGKGGGGAAGEVPAGDENDIVVLGPGGTSFVAVAPEAAVPVSADASATLRGVPVGGGPAAAAALNAAQIEAVVIASLSNESIATAKLADSAITSAKIADANVTLAKMANVTAGGVIGRATGAGTGVPTILTAAQLRENAGLGDALVYDDVVWDNGTTYAPNTLVKKTGSDTLYLQADVVDSTGDDPASGAPWEVWVEEVAATGGSPIDTFWARDMMVNTAVTYHTGSALSAGTVAVSSGYGASGRLGVVDISCTTATTSGYRYSTVSVATMEACTDLVSSIIFQVPTSTSTKSMQFGFTDATTADALGADGVFFRVVDGTISVFARAASAGSANATTGTVTAGVWYRAVIHWTSTTAASVRVRTLDGVTTILNVDLSSGLPTGTQQFGHAFIGWLNTGTTVVVLASIDDLAYGVIPGFDIDA